ncbi:uncharacterized protein LOC143904876 [Temnothorax americanus]|uniref:uncharacterized protein LOC143904876 n=1 Tax=Temnothorax americanus TaxID=1964332 RepID=UPI004067EB75
MPTYDHKKAENSRQSVNTCTTNKNLHFSTSTKNSETEILSRSNINKCSSNEIIVKKTVHSDKSSSPVTLDLDNISILEIPSVQEVYNILEQIEKNVDKITRENVKINFELTSISKTCRKQYGNDNLTIAN